MAPVAGHPFLFHVIHHLKKEGITRFIFSLGYMHEAIETYLHKAFPELDITIVIEQEPLGTGGAIQLACKHAVSQNILALNGDTLFAINLKEVSHQHKQTNAHCTVCLKPMENFDRYGVVDISSDKHIIQFQEKKAYKSGLINGGIYALKLDALLQLQLPEKFSFEKDYLEKQTQSHTLFGIEQDVYFIDIGIPEDFQKANIDLLSTVS
jgi:D-glycero-alpha-D-manno-heptose 1-phosphate guanylyltransferase